MVVLGMVVGVYFSPRSSMTIDEQKALEFEKDEIYDARLVTSELNWKVHTYLRNCHV